MISREPTGRLPHQIRPWTIETHVSRYAEGSALIRAGHTHVLCTASVEPKLPDWLIGKGQGWVTAEYAMLPRSTHTRSRREREKLSGRTHEIQRLIARALRGIVNLQALGERSIVVDCDVLQADGGTRTASITGGCVALILALERLHQEGQIAQRAWTDTVAAVSVGFFENTLLVDLDYQEDSRCDVDMNIVMTGSGRFIEVQGTAERNAYSKEQLDQMIAAASEALAQIRTLQQQALQTALRG